MQTMLLLTVNTGSSSLKLALYEKENLARKAILSVERIGSIDARLIVHGSSGAKDHKIRAKNHADALAEVIHDLPELFSSAPHAIGHRIVHGGAGHSKPEAITTHLLDELRELKHLDATHVPQALAVIDSLMRQFPNVPQFACFDTAFHRSMPEFAQRYPLPRWTSDAGVRRYGFHGLSCESILAQLKLIDARAAMARLLIAHLGNGASVTAVQNGHSIDTTMGFSPTGGLMMGTRCGDLDPTVMMYLARVRGMTTDVLEQLVNAESGLLGVSGESQDMRDLLVRAASDRQAAEAVELFCYVARKHFGALVATLGGVDTIIFTGGIGENRAPIREKICGGLTYLGVQLDDKRNAAHEGVISAESSRVVVRVMATDEDLMIARHVASLLKERSA